LYAQESLSFKNNIDSILLSRSHDGTKKIKSRYDSLYIRYFYARRTKELVLIETRQKYDTVIWSFNYHFIEGKLTMMNKWNGYPLKNKKKVIAFYYFNNETVLYKDENKTKIENTDLQRSIAKMLQLRAPKY